MSLYLATIALLQNFVTYTRLLLFALAVLLRLATWIITLCCHGPAKVTVDPRRCAARRGSTADAAEQ